MAAANAARNRGAPPPELTYAWQCKRWGALPEGGGLRDQPVRLMSDMVAALNVYDAMRSFWIAMKGTNIVHWQKAHPDEWSVVGLVIKLEKAHGS